MLKPYYETELGKLYCGDCLEILKDLPDNFIDSIVTDPPYGLSFMGKKWDYDVPSVDIWKEVLRVLKPGGHLLSFGGTRTYHRMVVNIEDAGFEIRDQIMWLYGSGFPKSLNISKSLDKIAGAERKLISETVSKSGGMGHIMKTNKEQGYRPNDYYEEKGNVIKVTEPATPEAKQWDGWGTALKPANEPICLARKPLSEKNIAQNVLKHGTGGINIDECRVETDEKLGRLNNSTSTFNHKNTSPLVNNSGDKGRFPANIILDEEAAEMLDEQSGISISTGGRIGNKEGAYSGIGDKGGASRFFYCAKTSKKERGECNNHPTVKPIKLMEYLVKLITPPNGIVLDPFTGSGSTGLACYKLGLQFISIEKEQKYCDIAIERLKNEVQYELFFNK